MNEILVDSEPAVEHSIYPHHRDFFSNYWEELEGKGVSITENGEIPEESYDQSRKIIREYYRNYVGLQLQAAIRFRDGINKITSQDFEPMAGMTAMCTGSDATWLVRHYAEITRDVNLVDISNKQYDLRQAGRVEEANTVQFDLGTTFEEVRQEVLADLDNAKNLVMHDVRFVYARFIDTYGPIENDEVPENTIDGAVETVMDWLTAPNDSLINVGIVEDDFCGKTHEGKHCLLVHAKNELVGRDKHAMEKLLSYLDGELDINIPYKVDTAGDSTEEKWQEIVVGDSGEKILYKYHPVSGVIRNVVLPIGVYRKSIRNAMLNS